VSTRGARLDSKKNLQGVQVYMYCRRGLFSFHVTEGSFRFDVEGAGVVLIPGAKFRFEKVGWQNIFYKKIF